MNSCLSAADANPDTRILTVPNALSAYRIAALLPILYAIASGNRILFAALVCISLATDILDGWLARVLKQTTRLGARLDSAGDMATYLPAVAGLLLLEWPFVVAHAAAFGLVLAFYAASQLLSFARFRKPVSMHLYSSKAAGYAQGAFFASYYFIGYSPALFQAVLAISIVSCVEELAATAILRSSREDARGLYWILKEARPCP